MNPCKSRFYGMVLMRYPVQNRLTLCSKPLSLHLFPEVGDDNEAVFVPHTVALRKPVISSWKKGSVATRSWFGFPSGSDKLD